MNKNILAFLAGMGTSFVAGKERQRKYDKENEAATIVENAYKDYFGTSTGEDQQKLGDLTVGTTPPIMNDERGALPQNNTPEPAGIISGIRGVPPTQSAAPAGNQMPTAKPATGNVDREDYSGFMNAAVKALISKGKVAEAAKMMEMDTAFQKRVYDDVLRKGRPAIQGFVMTGDPEALQVLLDLKPNGMEQTVTRTKEGKYIIHTKGRPDSKEMTKDEITQGMAYVVQSPENFTQSLLADIKSSREREQKNTDELAKEKRGETREIAKEKRMSIIDQQKEKYKNKLDQDTKKQKDLTPEEVKAAGLPKGTVAQRGTDGKITVLYNPVKDDKSGKDTSDIKNVERLLEKGIFKEEKDAWNFVKQGKTTSDVRSFAQTLLKYQTDNNMMQGDEGFLTPEQAYTEAQRIITGKGATAPKPDSNEPKVINTQEEYDALPSGAVYIDPDDNKKYRKP